MNWSNNLRSESNFVIWGCLYNDCDSCPSNENNTCPDLFLGWWVKTNKTVEILWVEIKEVFSSDRWDGL